MPLTQAIGQIRKMKKILCLIDGLGFGGAQRQIIGLTNFLSIRGYEVELVSYHKRDFYNDLLNRLNIKHTNLICNNKISKITSLIDYVKRGKYDVVISYLDGPNIYSCLLKLFGIKSKIIVSERITDINVTSYDRLKFNLYRLANYIVPNSHSEKDYIVQNFPFLLNKTKVITNFTETNYFVPSKTPHKVNEKVEILIAGRISDQKNILLFLDALKKVEHQNIQAHLSWYGNIGKGMEDYQRQVLKKQTDLNLTSMITFYSGTNNILEKYRECDAFCLPSLYEGFPNVICEAMSCGKPILCSNVCDNPYLVENGVNGFLFDPTNAESMATAISDFCNLNESQMRSMGAESRKKALEICSPETFVNKYIALIEN